MVIGRRCRHVPADRAAEGGGRLPGRQRRLRPGLATPLPTVTLGKSFDAIAPVVSGHRGTTSRTPMTCGSRTWVNGEQVRTAGPPT